MRDIQQRLRELAHENAQLREQAKDHAARTAGREEQLRSALISAHDHSLRSDAPGLRAAVALTWVVFALTVTIYPSLAPWMDAASVCEREVGG